MTHAKFLFHAELNDLLPSQHKEQWIVCTFKGRQTVKHLIESLGIPHTEATRLIANGAMVGFSYLVQDGDAIEVYPFNVAQDDLKAVMPAGEEPRFVLDNHLGKLATYLRILGLDAYYRNDLHDQELAEAASHEDRILLTRDRRLLMRKLVSYGYCLRSLDPMMQLREVVQRYGLVGHVRPFQRCLRCNTPLLPVAKSEVWHRLEPLTRLYYDEFRICPACDQLYWKGSHYERMLTMLAGILHTPNGEGEPSR
mgnify:CR=1 FL=1